MMNLEAESQTAIRGLVIANPPSSTKDRRWKRVPLDVRVKAVIEDDGHKTVVHGRSFQISEGGMGVTMTREIRKGTAVTLIFKLPGALCRQS